MGAKADQTPPEVTGSDLTLSGHITASGRPPCVQTVDAELPRVNISTVTAYLVTAPCPVQHLSLVEQTEDNCLLS